MSVWSTADGNAFRNYQQLSDIIIQPAASVHWMTGTQARSFQISYSALFSRFQEYPARQYLSHTAGISGSRALSESWRLFYGMTGGLRSNRTEYQYNNYSQYAVFLNIRRFQAGGGLWLLGGRFHGMDYEYLPVYSFLETEGFLQRSRFFKTKTTMIARVHIFHKTYPETVTSIEEAREAIENTVGPGRGEGRGRDGQGNSSGGKGNGNGGKHGSGGGTDAPVFTQIQGRNITQWQADLRLAQSIGTRTGLALQGTVRRRFQGSSRTLTYQDGGYEENDPLFDDPYSYEFDEVLVEWTRELPWRIQMKTGGAVTVKRYQTPAFDLEGNPAGDALRKDERSRLWVEVKKTMGGGKAIQNMDVMIYYLFLNNHSNDLYFEYSGHVFSLGFSASI